MSREEIAAHITRVARDYAYVRDAMREYGDIMKAQQKIETNPVAKPCLWKERGYGRECLLNTDGRIIGEVNEGSYTSGGDWAATYEGMLLGYYTNRFDARAAVEKIARNDILND